MSSSSGIREQPDCPAAQYFLSETVKEELQKWGAEQALAAFGPHPLPFDLEPGTQLISNRLRQSVSAVDDQTVPVPMVQVSKQSGKSQPQERPVLACRLLDMGCAGDMDALVSAALASRGTGETPSSAGAAEAPPTREYTPAEHKAIAAVGMMVVTELLDFVVRLTKATLHHAPHNAHVPVVYSWLYQPATGPQAGQQFVFQHNVIKREEGSKALAAKACISDEELVRNVNAALGGNGMQPGYLYLLPSLTHLPLSSDVNQLHLHLLVAVQGVPHLMLLPAMAVIKQQITARTSLGKNVPFSPTATGPHAAAPEWQELGLSPAVVLALEASGQKLPEHVLPPPPGAAAAQAGTGEEAGPPSTG